MKQCELEAKLREIMRPVLEEALNDLIFSLADAMAVEIIDRGLDDVWEDDNA